jgi:hypothetical protein
VTPTRLVIGTTPAAWLATGLDAEMSQLPGTTFDPSWSTAGELEAWRSAALDRPKVSEVVVAVWQEQLVNLPVTDTDLDDWLAGLETPFARWYVALTVGAALCDDGGRLVAVVDRPGAMAAAGWGSPAAIADAVEITARSLAELHRPRRVQLNQVITEARLVDEAGYSDAGARAQAQLADAVRALLEERTWTTALSSIDLRGAQL